MREGERRREREREGERVIKRGVERGREGKGGRLVGSEEQSEQREDHIICEGNEMERNP